MSLYPYESSPPSSGGLDVDPRLCHLADDRPSGMSRRAFLARSAAAGVGIATAKIWWSTFEARAEGPAAAASLPLVTDFLSQDQVAEILRRALARGAEFAEVYGEYTVNTSFVVDEQLLKTAQYGILQGAGIRVIHVFDDFAASQITFYDAAGWGDSCLGCTGFDGDRDGRCTGEPTFDCDDAQTAVWATPAEVPDLEFTVSDDILSWSEPATPGGTSLRYDTLRSGVPGNFSTAICVESDDGSDRTATDVANPPSGSSYYYLIRAENDCPSGQGSLGQRSDGSERVGRSCP